MKGLASLKSSSRSGFTFIEMVVVVGVSAFVALALALLYLNFNTLLNSENGQIAAANDAGRILTEVEALTLPADQVLASHSFAGTTYSSGASTLVLELPSIDSTGAVVAGKYDYAVIYQTSSTTTRILAPDAASARQGGTKRLAATVNSLAFAYDNTDFTLVSKVDVDVQTSSVSKGKTVTAHLHEALYLRNH